MAVLKYYNTTTSAWEYIAASTTANFTTWKKTMAGGETDVSGTDDNAVTLSYTAGLEQVFINGVLQVRGTDYTATNGTSIDSLSALVASDIVTVVCYAPFNVANTIAPTVVDAKGDLLAGTAADTVGRLAIGTDGQLLAADSGETTGLKWTNPGMTLLSTTTFSAVASVSLPDNTFSSTYDNYRIIFNTTAIVTGDYVYLRMRSSGSDDTGSNYSYAANGRSGAADVTSENSTGTTSQRMAYTDLATGVKNIVLDVYLPNKTNRTTWNYFASWEDSGSPNLYLYQVGGGVMRTATQYDSLSFFKSGTFTGTITAYGYNK
jgi:hypothetical protein